MDRDSLVYMAKLAEQAERYDHKKKNLVKSHWMARNSFSKEKNVENIPNDPDLWCINIYQ